MIAPSGIRFNPFDLSASVSHETRERAGSDRHPIESDNESFRSPYAPAGSRERAGAQGHSVENNYDPLQSPYAPKRARAQPGIEPDFAIAPARDHGRSGEMFEWALRSLEPERLGPPPPAVRSRRDNLLGALIFLIVSVLAAPIAYYVLVGRGDRPLRPQIAAFDSRFITPPSTSSGQKDSPTIIVRDDVLRARAEGELRSERPNSSPTTRSFGSETVATLQPGTPSVQAPPSSSKALRALDPEKIELLMKKGEQLLAAGDVVAARIAFQRAAEAGDGRAAVALGATYDPTELTKRGVTGMGADISKARSWYQKAEKFGSPEARGRLDALADR
jgi:hypothetical protein